MSDTYDAIIIGTGQAGPPLAHRLAADGQRVAVLERRHVGGSCVNFGCTPTKAMVASARAAWQARNGAALGVHIDGDVRVDLASIRAHRDALVTRARHGLREALIADPRIDLIEDHARFTGPRRVAAGGRELTAPRVFINTGTRAALPPIGGLAEARCLTPSGVMDLQRLPRQMVVLGGGATGVEYAQVFRRLGSRVTLLERHARLLDGEDSDISAAVQGILEDDGVEVITGARVRRVTRAVWGMTVEIETAAGDHELTADEVLLATGRRPNSDDLGLDAAGIVTDERGYIRVDRHLRTSADGVWALGDVNGLGAFTHTAWDDHRIAVDAVLGQGARSVDDRVFAQAVFLDPPLGRVGLSETETRACGHRLLLARMPMSEVARARERGETHGFMKVLVERDTGLILGAAVLGIGGDEVIHCFLAVMTAGAPYTALRGMVGIHPTVSELIPTLLERLAPVEPPSGDISAS